MRRNLWSTEGLVYIGGYPFQYSDNMLCNRMIRALSDARITVTVKNFDIEWEETCMYDFMRVRQVYLSLFVFFSSVSTICEELANISTSLVMWKPFERCVSYTIFKHK